MNDDDKFSAEKLSHPERWKHNGAYRVLWIADSGLGAARIHLVYVDDWGLQRNTAVDGEALTYTAPDPWEGVELPEIELQCDGNGDLWIKAKWAGYGGSTLHRCDVPFTLGNLPPRKFKLVPL